LNLRERWEKEIEEILHNEKLYNLYYSQDSFMVIRLRRMRRAGHAARMGEIRYAYILVGILEVKNHLGNVCVDGKVILKRILQK
jgi:hypothetical protein